MADAVADAAFAELERRYVEVAARAKGDLAGALASLRAEFLQRALEQARQQGNGAPKGAER